MEIQTNGFIDNMKKESKKAIRGIINELREHGYLVTEQARGEKFYYKYILFFIFKVNIF